MPANVLVTGPPGSGKTTAVGRARERLAGRGYVADGVRAPEVREDGERVGFDIVSLRDGRRAPMARVGHSAGPTVGSYRVDVAAVDRCCEHALAPAGVDYLLVDEIGPMQVHSDGFVRRVRAALDGTTPVLATVKADPDDGFVADCRARTDAAWFEVTPEPRDGLPARLAGAVARRIDG